MIKQFRDENRFLSNFFPAEVEWDGHKFPSVEHAFVFAKTDVEQEQIIVLEACKIATAGQIKRFGKSLSLRPNWKEFRLEVMFKLLQEKFKIPVLREKLLATGEQELVEGNTWGDVFWGVNLENGEGENNLGKLLMKVREEIRSTI